MYSHSRSPQSFAYLLALEDSAFLIGILAGRNEIPTPSSTPGTRFFRPLPSYSFKCSRLSSIIKMYPVEPTQPVLFIKASQLPCSLGIPPYTSPSLAVTPDIWHCHCHRTLHTHSHALSARLFCQFCLSMLITNQF